MQRCRLPARQKAKTATIFGCQEKSCNLRIDNCQGQRPVTVDKKILASPGPAPLTSGGGESKYYQGYLSKIPKKGVEEMASNGSGGVMVLCPECETDLDVEEEEVDEG
jgi:hypothetical protein